MLVKSNHVIKSLKDIILNATTYIHICKRNSQTKCGFHLQFADSTNTLRIPLIVADSATAQFNYTHVLLFVCGLQKLFWIPQTRLRIPQIRLFWSDFERNSVLSICLWNQ